MRFTSRTLLVLVLCLAIAGCGSSSKDTVPNASSTDAGSDSATTTSGAATGSSNGYLKNDGDSDFDEGRSYHGVPENDDRALLRSYGPRANAIESRTIAGLVRSYYAASAAGNGKQACALLDSSIVAGLEAGQSGAARGIDACAQPMSTLLEQQRQHLLAENVATMTIIGVYVKGSVGLAVVGFQKAPESNMLVEREGRTWKIDALFDSEMP